MVTDDGSDDTSASPRLVVVGLARSWGGQLSPSALSFEAGAGITAILGPNGAGKTSLLRMLASSLAPTRGTASLDGVSLNLGSSATRRGVCFVPHEPPFWPHLSVRENLVLMARLAGVDSGDASARVAAALGLWGISHAQAEGRLSTLSRGWRQRASLARVDAVQAPRLVLLDEPTTGLDRDGRALLESAMSRWSKAAITLVATHELDWISARAGALVDLALPSAVSSTGAMQWA